MFGIFTSLWWFNYSIVVLAHEVKQGLISAVNPAKCSADLSSMPHRVFWQDKNACMMAYRLIHAFLM